MKIALVQFNPIVGDILGNTSAMLKVINNIGNSADVIVFSELATTGYPPHDLLLKSNFVDDNIQAKDRIVQATTDIKAAVIFGYAERNFVDGAKPLFNAVCVAQGGKTLQTRYKSLLPTYDVFEERRYFEPGSIDNIMPVTIAGVSVGVIVCEESWNDRKFWDNHEYPYDPVDILKKRGAQYIIRVNASPFRLQDSETSVAKFRLQMVQEQTKRHSLPGCYVNQVGANDELIFDGNSFALDGEGNIVAWATPFNPDIIAFEHNATGKYDTLDEFSSGLYDEKPEHQVLNALILGVRDYFRKQPYFAKAPAFIGLSGGIDSALVAYIAVQALGPDRVVGVSMPSEYSSDHSKSDAALLARKLGIRFITEPIVDPHSALRIAIDDMNCNLLEQRFGRDKFIPCKNDTGTTDENLQARIRGMYLMALSNYHNGMVLSTGNKSELAVGYCTLYGDMCGGLAVISDVPKTMVFRIAKFINNTTHEEIIPWNTINKPPSAELKPGQFDQQTLPPYDVLDGIIERFVDNHESVAQITKEMGPDLAETIKSVCRKIMNNEYKRRQAPKGLKITRKHFGYGWHMPIVHSASL